MKFLKYLLFACGTLAWAQFPAVPIRPEVPDSTVVAIMDGTPVTMAQVRGWLTAQPPQIQQQYAQDPAILVNQVAMLQRLSDMAKQNKLDKESPTKDMLYFSQINILGPAMAQKQYQTVEVLPDEIVKEYDATKSTKYIQVKVDAIYIAFGDASLSADKKVLTEEQAKAKAGKLLEEIRKGADFAKLARENSDDQTSREKGGYLDTLTPGDNIPEGFQIVFQMKAGDTSEPLRQPNGFYLLHAESVDFRPLKDVRDRVFNDLKQKHFNEWMDKVHRDIKVEYPNPAFQPKQPAPAPGGAPSK